MKKLPLGVQTFKKIRTEDYIYIDKTKEAFNLINNYSYAFLSRPRRFGKSLFLDTLREIFRGNKELFKGLYIYDKHDFEPHPVIKISWAGDFKTLESTKKVALNIFKENQENLEIECDEKENPSVCFRELIRKAYKKYNKRVVILVDEYDKPILDNIEKENLKVAEENREFLRGLYTVIKDSDEYIRFAFLTGVSRFSKVSIFSGLNNLEDISLLPEFGEICGFTHDNLLNEFADYTKDTDLEEVRKWYNGYWFLGEDKVYNPFDLLSFLKYKKFSNYWFKTGTPSFLVKLLKERNYNILEFENLEVDESILDSFDIENIKLESLMFQSGYLTIKEVKEILVNRIFVLTFPNLEVKMSFNDYLLDILINDSSKKTRLKLELIDVLLKVNLEKLKEVLISLYASIPYNYFIHSKMHEYESYYAMVLYMYLSGAAGIETKVEEVTSKGRIDLVAIVLDKVYIFELKLNGEAIGQIEDKKYYEKYLNYPEVYIIGVEFDKEKKNVKKVEWKKIK